MSRIRVERQKGYYGSIRALKVIVDGVRVGVIKQGQTITFNVPDSPHEIWGEMDWAETEHLDLSEYDENKTVVFKAFFTLNIFRNFGLSKMPFDVFLRDSSKHEIAAEQDMRGNWR